MSVSVKEIFNVGGSGGGEDHGEEGDDDGNSGKKQRWDGYGSASGGCARDFRKAKQVILQPFTMAKKQLLRNTRSATTNAGTSGRCGVAKSICFLAEECSDTLWKWSRLLKPLDSFNLYSI